MYGWKVNDVLNLTVTELRLLQDAMLERLNTQNAVLSGERKGFVKPGTKLSVDEFVDKFPEAVEG